MKFVEQEKANSYSQTQKKNPYNKVENMCQLTLHICNWAIKCMSEEQLSPNQNLQAAKI